MKRYIALLRGINISGKNKISMSALKREVAELGFTAVATYLNSGNVIFSSDMEDENDLSRKMEFLIKDTFNLDVPVFVVSQEALEELLRNAPDWWGNGNKEQYDNIIFLIPPLSYDAFYKEMGAPKAEYEKVQLCKNAIFWTFSRKDYQRTNWWSRTAGSNIRGKITIRTANTVRKIVGM